jgi:hypothetical protein
VAVVFVPQRRFHLVMAVLAALLALLQGTTGLPEVALFAGPVLLLAGLLVCGRFVGEEHIVRRLRRAAADVSAKRIAARWPRVPARTLASLLAHDPRVEHGPPHLVSAA